QPVVLGFDESNLVKLENKESTLQSYRLTPIVVNPWGSSSKSISTKYVSTVKIALYERTADNTWDIKVGTMKSEAMRKLLLLNDEDSIRESDDSILSRCLLRLKLGSNRRVNPKRMKFLYDSVDCNSLANVLFGNDIHLIEVDRSAPEGEIRALVESEMIGPSKLSSNDANRILFDFNKLKIRTFEISEGENAANPWGTITSTLSGKVQSWLHRSIVEGTPIVNFECIDTITEREKYVKHQHIVQETDLSIENHGPDQTQSQSVFAYISLANKRLFHNIKNGHSLTEILWKTTGYLRSVYFGAPVRMGHSRLLDLRESENLSLRRKIRNIQTQTGGTEYREASLLEVVDFKGNSLLQMTEINQKRGFLFHSIDSSKFSFIPEGWSLNDMILDTEFWLKDLPLIEKWMNDSKEFTKFRKKVSNLTRIKDECYEIESSEPIDVEARKQLASKIYSSIICQIDEFAIEKGLCPSDVIDTNKFVQAVCETVLLTKNNITTEPERASLSFPYHLDTNGMPIKVPNSLCPVSAEHLTAFFSSLGSYSRYSSLLNKIERNSMTDFRQSFAIDARPANGGSDVVILSVGSEGRERMYEIENKTYRYTDYQDRYATRQRMLKRMLESNEFDNKYHTINFVDAQKEFNKEQVSYMLEPSLTHSFKLEYDEDSLVTYIKSSVRVRYAILSRIKQVASVSNDTFTIQKVSPRLETLRTFYRFHFGNELIWKGEKRPREKAIDWSSLAGVSIDQSLIRLSGKRLFESTHFALLQNELSPLIADYLETVGWT
ncbi:MAG: hypothetical protein KAU48_09350, partial [Candidatus Thorarchaeota archaeon]|nr:hypothetical protein [Candidatus Thorarchaeota archaeon]